MPPVEGGSAEHVPLCSGMMHALPQSRRGSCKSICEPHLHHVHHQRSRLPGEAAECGGIHHHRRATQKAIAVRQTYICGHFKRCPTLHKHVTDREPKTSYLQRHQKTFLTTAAEAHRWTPANLNPTLSGLRLARVGWRPPVPLHSSTSQASSDQAIHFKASTQSGDR